MNNGVFYFLAFVGVNAALYVLLRTSIRAIMGTYYQIRREEHIKDIVAFKEKIEELQNGS